MDNEGGVGGRLTVLVARGVEERLIQRSERSSERSSESRGLRVVTSVGKS